MLCCSSFHIIQDMERNASNYSETEIQEYIFGSCHHHRFQKLSKDISIITRLLSDSWAKIGFIFPVECESISSSGDVPPPHLILLCNHNLENTGLLKDLSMVRKFIGARTLEKKMTGIVMPDHHLPSTYWKSVFTAIHKNDDDEEAIKIFLDFAPQHGAKIFALADILDTCSNFTPLHLYVFTVFHSVRVAHANFFTSN